MNKVINKLTAWPTAKLIILTEFCRNLVIRIYCWINSLAPKKMHWEDTEENAIVEKNVILMWFWRDKCKYGTFELFGGFVKHINFKEGLIISNKPVLFTKDQAKGITRKFKSGRHPNIDLKTERLQQFTIKL